MLFGKVTRASFNNDELLEKLYSAQKKCRDLDETYLIQAELHSDDGFKELALTCRHCADVLGQCCDIVVQMLPPRDKIKARRLESKSKALLKQLNESLSKCGEHFEYPIRNGTITALVNELKALFREVTEI